jgi:hypothetical protein
MRNITINNKMVRKIVIKRIGPLPKIRTLKFSFRKKNHIWLVGEDQLPKGSDCRSFPKASAVPR